MKNMTANILLSRAATYVERYGLTKGAFSNGKTPRPAVCAGGALIVAKYDQETLEVCDFGDSQFKNVIVKSAIRKIGKVLGITDFDVTDLASWSDGTTKDQVVSTMRAAIKVR
jgi:hypothetical protein